MEQSELTISIRSFNNIPMLSASGKMQAWHGAAFGMAVQSFVDTADGDVILDLSNLSFCGNDGKTAFLLALRSVPEKIHVHTVASEEIEEAINRFHTGSAICLSKGFDHLAETLRPDVKTDVRYLTSRWIANEETLSAKWTEEGEGLPLAA